MKILLLYLKFDKERVQQLISKDGYLLACGSYVELNQLRAKIVSDPKDYPWSSYNTYAYVHGNEKFTKRLSKQYKIAAVMKHRGRPRKEAGNSK